MKPTLPIASIRIGERFRKDMGDLDRLKKSIAQHGLLHPIVVDKAMNLVAGMRRIKACASLGWSEVPARVLDIASLIEAESDENDPAVRKDFTVSERVAIADAITLEIGNRQGQRTDASKKVGEMELRAQGHEVEPGERTAAVAAEKAKLGSEQNYRRAKKVVDQAIPEVREAMDAGDVSVRDAAAVADKPAREQKKAIEKVKAGKAPTLKAAVADKPAREQKKEVKPQCECGAKKKTAYNALESNWVCYSTPGQPDRWVCAKCGKRTTPSEDNPLMDRFDRPVPDVAVPASEDADFFKGALHHLDRLMGRLKEIHASVARHLKGAPNILADLKNVISAVRGGMFYSACVYCLHKGHKIKADCRACKGTGWLTKQQVESAPKEMTGGK